MRHGGQRRFLGRNCPVGSIFRLVPFGFNPASSPLVVELPTPPWPEHLDDYKRPNACTWFQTALLGYFWGTFRSPQGSLSVSCLCLLAILLKSTPACSRTLPWCSLRTALRGSGCHSVPPGPFLSAVFVFAGILNYESVSTKDHSGLRI